MTDTSVIGHCININRMLTRTIMRKINAIPAPAQVVLSYIPGWGAALTYAQLHDWTIYSLACQRDEEKKLSTEAGNALHAYTRALAQQQRAWERFLRSFEREA